MTLGRTSDNKIKIKTDGGTTSAVECACCNPCLGAPNAVQKQTTESYYNMWKKGGQLKISATLGDTAYNPPNATKQNGICSWSFSETISIPANTCVGSFSKEGPVSCSGDYYGYSISPSVLIFLSVIKHSDGNYYSQIYANFKCPFLLIVNSFLEMCSYSVGVSGSNYILPYTQGDSGPLDPFVFFGADFAVVQPNYAQGAAAQGQSVTPTTLNFQFTPNP